MAPKRTASSTTTNGKKAKIQKTLPFKSVKEEKVQDSDVSSESDTNDDIPKGKDGKVDYKSLTNLLPKDFVEKSEHNVFIGAHMSISGKKFLLKFGFGGNKIINFCIRRHRKRNY